MAIRDKDQPDLPLVINHPVLQVIQRLTVLNELEMELVIRNVILLLVTLMVVIANPNRVPQVIQLIIVLKDLQMANVILNATSILANMTEGTVQLNPQLIHTYHPLALTFHHQTKSNMGKGNDF